MTIETPWTPELAESEGPLYRSLAAEIGRAIESGELSTGARLPTQRELAGRLGIALTTVTRGYGEAERRGWIRSEVGRGTFVRSAEAPDERAALDLRPNILQPAPFERELRESAARVVRDGASGALFDYGPHAGRLAHREAGARLFSAMGADASPERVLVTAGVQHAMFAAFATLCAKGETLLVEERTYSGVKTIAQTLGLRLQPVALDEEGVRPDALAAAAKKSGAKVLYAMSVLQNPSSAVATPKRIEALARTIERLGLTLIEDDTYGFLLPEAPRLGASVPGAYCMAGTSKSLFPTLRVGYLHAPAAALPALERAVAATVYLTSPLAAEMAATWIGSGLYERVVAWKREETRARQAIAIEMLRTAAGLDYVAHPASPHGWLELPAGWSSAHLVAAAAERGVLLSPGEIFAVAPSAARRAAVRLVVGPVATREALVRALGVVAELAGRHAEAIPQGGMIA